MTEIFSVDITGMEPRHISMLAWAMVKMKYKQPDYVDAVVQATEALCTHCSQVWKVNFVNFSTFKLLSFKLIFGSNISRFKI